MSTTRARRLRKQSTEAEKILWRALRDRQIGGRKFRRQHPLGPYVVDFLCPEINLVIELDGGQHASDGPERTLWLGAAGYRVPRFWNNDLFENLDGVMQTIDSVIADLANAKRCDASIGRRLTKRAIDAGMEAYRRWCEYADSVQYSIDQRKTARATTRAMVRGIVVAVLSNQGRLR